VNDPASAVAQTNGNRLWFHGKAQDESTGLQYFGARYYDPAIGRFMAMDPATVAENNVHGFQSLPVRQQQSIPVSGSEWQ